MSTPNNEFLVITYQWLDHRAKWFNDKAAAFYIDGVTPENYELAKDIFLAVYNALLKVFEVDPNLQFDMSSCVEQILEKYKSKSL